jgi:hypothetical protein
MESLAGIVAGNPGGCPSNSCQAESSIEDQHMNIRRQLTVIATFAAIVPGSPAAAQNGIVIDWASRTVVSSPSTLGSTLSTTVLVRNVNDVLYDYDVDLVETLRQIDDFGHIAGAVRAAPSVAADNCSGEVAQIRSEMTAVSDGLTGSAQLTPKPDKDGAYPSVRLSATLAAWKQRVEPPLSRARGLAAALRAKIDQCSSSEARRFLDDEYRPFDNEMRLIERRLAGTHVIQVPITLRPDADYTIVVTEKFNGVATIDGTKKFIVSPASTVLTLSSGFGATWLEGRTYNAAATPGANPGDPNRVQLRVDGEGVRPVVPLLLNFELPFRTNGDWGVALSGGPVLAFGSGTTNSSSLGFFGGLSFHLFHRVYITPGFHLGEFADFPLGFESAGATIPDKFGDLTPRKRWTTKVAVMMTFRTLDFSKLVSKPKVTEEKPAEKPKPTEKPKPDDKG